MFVFSKHLGVSNSNEVEVLAILEVLQISPSLFHGKLIMESDSLNAISRVSSLGARLAAIRTVDSLLVFLDCEENPSLAMVATI